MNSRSKLGLLSMFLMAGAANSTRDIYHEDSPQRVSKSKADLARKYSTNKTNQKTFVYKDGFKCEALHQKSADKKHKNWLLSKTP